MSDEQKPVAWHYKKEGGGWFVSDNEPQYVEQWNDIEESKPLYTHPAPAVVKQLVEALQSTEMFLDYVYNPKNKPTSFNLLMQQIIIVEQALAAAKEAGL